MNEAAEEQVFVEDLASSFNPTPWIPEALHPAWAMIADYPITGGLNTGGGIFPARADDA